MRLRFDLRNRRWCSDVQLVRCGHYFWKIHVANVYPGKVMLQNEFSCMQLKIPRNLLRSKNCKANSQSLNGWLNSKLRN